MVGDVGWALIALAAVVLEIWPGKRGHRSTGLDAVSAVLARRGWWSMILFALWCFAGVHLFSRYGVRR